MEDSADIFDSCLFALFAVPPIGFSAASPSDPWTYTPPAAPSAPNPPSSSPSSASLSAPTDIKLWLPQPPASLYAALQANNLWLSAVYLSDRIARGELLTGSGPGSGSAPILELGAGAGLPTIMAARAGRDVVCTDYDDGEVVRTIRRNFGHNLGGAEVGGTGVEDEGGAPDEASPVKASVPGSGRWAVRGHTWGTTSAPLRALATEFGSDGFDLILADTLWTTAGHGALLESVLALLRPGGTAHVTAGLHTGRGPVNRFMAAAVASGLRVEKHEEVRWLPEGGWGVYEDEEGEGEGEVRGVVVYYTLHKA